MLADHVYQIPVTVLYFSSIEIMLSLTAGVVHEYVVFRCLCKNAKMMMRAAKCVHVLVFIPLFFAEHKLDLTSVAMEAFGHNKIFNTVHTTAHE